MSSDVDTEADPEADPDLTPEIHIAASFGIKNNKIGFEGSRKYPNQMRCSSSNSSHTLTRCRPKTIYEVEPFLKIDTTRHRPNSSFAPSQHQKSSEEEKTSQLARRSSDPSGNSKKSLCKLFDLPSCSPYSESKQIRPKKPTRSRTTGSAGMHPNTQKSPKVNHHVKMPFKHSVSMPSTQQEKVSPPSQGMKDRTAFATRQMNQMLLQKCALPKEKAKGKLLVGRLKPLYPVKKEGPSMELCRGIYTHTRAFTECPSRYYQRHKLDRGLLCESESIHRTSVASSDQMSDQFDQNRSCLSLSPLSIESDLLSEEPTNWSHNATKQENVERTLARKDDDIDPFTKEALKIASQELIEAVDNLKDKLFPSNETSEINIVKSSKNVNDNNSNKDEHFSGVQNSIQKQLHNGNGKSKQNTFITEEAETGSVKTDTDSNDQRPFSATTISVTIKTVGQPLISDSTQLRPQTTGSFDLKGNGSKSVRFADQKDKTRLSKNNWTNGLHDTGHRKPQPQRKPSRTTCKPQQQSSNAKTHDGDDDKENIPRKMLSFDVGGKGTEGMSCSNSTTNPGCQSKQGNVDGLESQCCVEEQLFTESTFKSTTDSRCESKQRNVDEEQLLSLPGSEFEKEKSEEQLLSLPGSEFEKEESELEISDGMADVPSHTDLEQSILHQLQVKEMEPLVIELAESKRIEEGTDSYNVSECSTVLGVLEKYPDLSKYLKVESVTGNTEELSADSSEPVSSESVTSGSQKVFKITFSSHEPPEQCPPTTSSKSPCSQNMDTETEIVSKSLRRLKKKSCKGNVEKLKKSSSSRSSVPTIQFSYEASSRENFPSDILNGGQKSAKCENSKCLDIDSVPGGGSFNECSQTPSVSRSSSALSHPCSESSRKTRPSSASSSRPFPISPYSLKTRPSSASSSRSHPISPVSSKPRPASASFCRSHPISPVSSKPPRSSNASSGRSHPISAFSSRSLPTSVSSILSNSKRLSNNSAVSSRASQQSNSRVGFVQKYMQKLGRNPDDDESSVPLLDLTNPLSFDNFDGIINTIQSELRRNIDDNALLLSQTENIREALQNSSSPGDHTDVSSNSDLDSAVCDEGSSSVINPDYNAGNCDLTSGTSSGCVNHSNNAGNCDLASETSLGWVNPDNNAGNFDLASEDCYQDTLLTYRKMCMDISEDCLVISDELTTRRWQKSQVYDAVNGNGSEHDEFMRASSLKSQLGVFDSECESDHANVLNAEVTDKRETTSLFKLLCETLPENKDECVKITKNEFDNPDLEVIATKKTLSKPKKKAELVKSSALFPPLCFSVNARPPPGCLYYFTYGTDMNIDRISNYLNRKVVDRFWGLLFGFSLVFNKKGFDVAAGGFPNIEFNPLCSVEGCVYQLTPSDVQVLDKCIGYPEHYEHVMLPVWMSNCSDPDSLGVAQYCVPALTYIAQDKWIEKDLVPCEFAVSQCLKSSDLTTPKYREYLQKIEEATCLYNISLKS